MVGEYRAEIRLKEGKEESKEPGYSLTEVRDRLAKEPRTLTLRADKRFVMRTGDRSNEGAWRVEGDTLILRDDTSNGVFIQEVLRKDRVFRIGPGGEIINEGVYSRYNLDEVFVRK